MKFKISITEAVNTDISDEDLTKIPILIKKIISDKKKVVVDIDKNWTITYDKDGLIVLLDYSEAFDTRNPDKLIRIFDSYPEIKKLRDSINRNAIIYPRRTAFMFKSGKWVIWGNDTGDKTFCVGGKSMIANLQGNSDEIINFIKKNK